ncbi:MAG: glycoside hydrolase family 95 protein, partial [Muribaculaceae bacterium]|nr:glycoside hydrolase family 95 protein [Muribaculaceae bacterium]
MKRLFPTVAAVLACIMPGLANDLTLKFDRPADFFEETFVLGNGTQGAIVYGNPSRERISLNDITLWTGEPDTAVYSPGAYKSIPAIREALEKGDYAGAEKLQLDVQGHYSQNYQPLGNLFIDFADKSQTSSYHRELDLNNAKANVTFTRSGNMVTTEYIASAPDSVIAVRLSSRNPIDLTLSFDSPLKYSVTSSGARITADGYASYTSLPSYVKSTPEEEMLYDPNRGIRFRADISAKAASGKIIPTSSGALDVKGTTELTIYVTIATNFAGANTNPSHGGIDYQGIADRRADAAMSKSFDELESNHVADYSRLFSRVNLDLGASDPAFASLPTDV